MHFSVNNKVEEAAVGSVSQQRTLYQMHEFSIKLMSPVKNLVKLNIFYI